jgi:hypothetical protein
MLRAISGVVLFLLVPLTLAGSLTRGAVSGSILTADGQPVSGALVQLAGDAAPGIISVKSDAQGRFEMKDVLPGDSYLVTVRAEQIGTAVRPARVELGKRTTLRIVLEPALLSEQIVVTADAPVVDSMSAVTAINLSSALITALPGGRHYQTLFAVAPGVTFFRKLNSQLLDEGLNTPSPNVHGASTPENDYLVDGLSLRNPRTGLSTGRMPTEAIQEIRLVTGGMPAEYGRATGGLFTAATKSGGNELSGSLYATMEDSDWGSEPVPGYQRGNPGRVREFDRRSLNATLGGPLMRDSAWFYLSYDPRSTVYLNTLRHPQTGELRDERISTHNGVYLAKVTAAPSSATSLTISAFGDPSRMEGWMGGPRSTTESGTNWMKGGIESQALRYHQQISARSDLEVLMGRFRQDESSGPSHPAGSFPQFDGPSGWFYGHVNTARSIGKRESLAARSSYRFGDHDLRAGAEYERNEFDPRGPVARTFFYQPDMLINADLGRREAITEYVFGPGDVGTNQIHTAFMQDRWLIRSNLVLEAGVRLERQVLATKQGAYVASGTDSDGRLLTSWTRDFTFTDLAPRVGLSWDPRGEGTGRIYGFYGRFVEALPVHLAVTGMGGSGFRINQYYANDPVGSGWWNPAGSPIDQRWTMFSTTGLEASHVPIHAGTRMQHVDEWSFGGETQLTRRLVGSVRLSDRRVGRVIESMTVGSGSAGGQPVVGNVGRGVFGDEWGEPVRVLQTVELTVHRHHDARWGFLASFLHARARGDYEGLMTYTIPNLGGHMNGRMNRPYQQSNANGRLFGDVPYQFKLSGSYTFPFGLTVGETFVYSAGTPVSALAPTEGNGAIDWGRFVYLTPRGSMGRTPDYWSIDLRLEQRLPVYWRSGTVSVILDALNATDNRGVLQVDEEYAYPQMAGGALWYAPGNRDSSGAPRFDPALPRNPWWGTAQQYQQPRSLQAAVRIRY